MCVPSTPGINPASKLVYDGKMSAHVETAAWAAEEPAVKWRTALPEPQVCTANLLSESSFLSHHSFCLIWSASAANSQLRVKAGLAAFGNLGHAGSTEQWQGAFTHYTLASRMGNFHPSVC